MSTSDAFQWGKTTIAHGIFVGYLQNGTEKLRLQTLLVQIFAIMAANFTKKTEFRTHLTAKTARGVAAHVVVVGYAVRG